MLPHTKAEFGLNEGQLRTLAICNVAPHPARIIVGMVLDRYGPRLPTTHVNLTPFATLASRLCRRKL